ncbi:hypothetical protein BIT28_06865 [Photobacterium proteolyticum]|uniref:Uncharacterized protein n=1 Tax=Photobacterium proteolyticum TaxID=1903952 RepID=A0A1Q9GF16_9GAMM|nr:hypothetical protein [Photobacterium proteolyticum]OLQ72899.1 hypothetical protein BIT28_06865 [Photobacterium proteolyticum]
MKKKILTLSTVLAVFSSFSFADISIADSNSGAWVTVSDSGKPSVNATVTVENQPQIKEIFKTNENGRVFVPLSINHSTSIKYKAVTEDGKTFSRFAFHGE